MRIFEYFTPYDLDRINKAIAYIEEHYQDAISADQLAIEVGMDIKKLQAGIQWRTGHTVHNYLLSTRVARAADDLLDFSRPIKYIAYKNGFCSASHFGAEFKKRMGVTPKEYRYQLILSNRSAGAIGGSYHKVYSGS